MANPGANPIPGPAPQPNPNPEPAVAPLTMQQFIELGKLPDFIRDLQVFDGQPTELLAWLTDVEGIFSMYRDAGATEAQLVLIERSIRRKIKGEAADVLNANNILHDWNLTKSTLLLYYRDKRDIKTLDFELTSIKKSNSESLGSYYSRVNELLSSIIAQIQTEEKYFLHATSHIDYFREKAIDAFIRGLEKPLCHLLKTFNPKTLNQAYQFCLDYFNMDARSAPFRNEHASHIPKPREFEVVRNPPRPPPRRPPPMPAPRNAGNLYQPPTPFPRNIGNNYQTPSFQPPPRPWGPKPQPKPEPMEVDHSIRTRNVNYGNRPPVQQKRTHPPSNQIQQYKRVAHPLEYADYADDSQYLDYMSEYEDYPAQYGSQEEEDSPNPQYYGANEEQSIEQEDPEPQSSSQTNFLEWKPSW